MSKYLDPFLIDNEKLPKDSMKALDLINALQFENSRLRSKIGNISSQLQSISNDFKYIIEQIEK